MEKKPQHYAPPLTPAERRQMRDRDIGSIVAEREVSQPASRRVDLGKVIGVRSGLEGGRCALWERHPSHPGGGVLVYGPRTFRAALTPAVAERLVSGQLEEVKESKGE